MYLPNYNTLSIEAILEFGKNEPRVASYLPDERDLPRLPRQFIINITYSIMKDHFVEWTDQQIKARNEKLADKQHLNLHVDPEIAAAFNRSQNISSKWLLLCRRCKVNHSIYLLHIASNGVSVNLLKAGSKRRRTQAEMREQYDKELLEEQALLEDKQRETEQAARIAELSERIRQLDGEVSRNDAARVFVENQIQLGQIGVTEEGDLVMNRGTNVIGNAHDQENN